jgi:hypothetical protein
MQTEINSELSQTGVHDPAETSEFEAMVRFEHDLSDVISALALLGVKRCSQCKQFFRSSDPGALFENGHTVCYKCIPEWWTESSQRLNVAERERLEGKLASWLRKHHNAEVVKEAPGKVFDVSNSEFQIVAKCVECGGTGKLMEGERCRFCNGFGTVRIVVPK